MSDLERREEAATAVIVFKRKDMEMFKGALVAARNDEASAFWRLQQESRDESKTSFEKNLAEAKAEEKRRRADALSVGIEAFENAVRDESV